MPHSPFGFLRTRLFSTRAKLGLLAEPWRPRSSPSVDETVAAFVVRRLGREFLDYAINPFVGGVYAGDPEQLSVRHGFPKLHALEQKHGSLIRGAISQRNTQGGPSGRIFSFPNGLQEIPETLAAALGEAVLTQASVGEIRRTDNHWDIRYFRAGQVSTDSFSAVICAVPATELASLPLAGLSELASLASLKTIPQPSVISVFTGYRREDVAHPLDGFGLLVPEVERRSILGTLFSSTLFPGRAPHGHVALTSFVGGTRNPELVHLSDQELTARVHAELSLVLGARQPPIYTHLHRWPRAIPQYNIGYQRFKDAIESTEATAPGLFIGGNARDGISLSNCIGSGQRLAREATAFLKSAQLVAPH
jgi:oxygen-dependent protoporphyrinogen oxidase